MALARLTRTINPRTKPRDVKRREALSSHAFTSLRFLSAGFTLAESLVASVVLAIAVVAVSGAIIASQKQSLCQEESSAATMLGRQLLEEVLAKPLVLSNGTTGQPGWPSVTDRTLYDTTGDFDGYTDIVSVSTTRGANITNVSASSTGASAPATVVMPAAASPTLQPQQYKRTVAVTFPTSLFGTTVTAGDFAVVTVTVQGGANGTKVQLARLVSKVTYLR
jgi:prepilin-type N-terminal cleavage/methylation domain-containing protein